MSVALVLNVHDGVVLAADSASSISMAASTDLHGPASSGIVANVYHHANKITNLVKGMPIGCAAFGSGSIGNSSISTLLKDFRKQFAVGLGSVDRENYTIQDVADRLGGFLNDECSRQPLGAPRVNLGIFLAGYSSGESFGERWSLSIENGQAQAPVRLHEPEQVGINWGGEGGEAVTRLLVGYGSRLPDVLKRLVQPEPAATQLSATLLNELRVQVLFAPMPIQDAIDLARFLVQTAIGFSRFAPGAQIVGGPIEIAAITKHEGFKWIERKHYYDIDLNREVPNDSWK